MKRVCLDPGHGVETPGKRSPDGTYREHEFALDMARRLTALLERHGVAVTLTRKDEHDVTLPNRVKLANAIKDLDLFVSLHSNAGGSGAAWTSARGLVAYAYGDAVSNRAAERIMARHKAAGVTVRNGGKAADGSHLYVVRCTKAPAVLVEHLFHDNKEDVALLKDSNFRQKLAEADAKGILDFLGLTWKEDTDMTAEDVKKIVTQETEGLRGQVETLEKALRAAEKKLETAKGEPVYHSLEEVPEWGRETVRQLMLWDRLRGDENGDLRLGETLLRALVILRRGVA